MKAFLIFILFCFTFSGYAQNELFVVDKANDKIGGRIAKGSFLKIRTADGRKFSGTLIKVKAYTIELARYSAVVDIDEITALQVIEKKGSLGLLPIEGFGLIYFLPQGRLFKTKYWKFFVKEG